MFNDNNNNKTKIFAIHNGTHLHILTSSIQQEIYFYPFFPLTNFTLRLNGNISKLSTLTLILKIIF